MNASPADPENFAVQTQVISAVYLQARALAERGVHVMSTDEKTGMQALERARLGKPMKPGTPERQEAEYVRHGTRCLITSLEVATGRLFAPHVGPTRKEEDFLDHISCTVATAPSDGWIFVADNLNTHQSRGLVTFVAQACQIDLTSYPHPVMGSMPARAAFLSNPAHRIRFVYTPKHCSWLNQIELFFAVIARRVLRRGSFASLASLEQRVLDFIRVYNERWAKAYRWTYTGRPLEK